MRAALTSLAAIAALAAASAPAAASPAGAPPVVPALNGWRDAPGSTALRRDARVVVRSRSLLAEGRTLAADLARARGRRTPVLVRSRGAARPGDVVLRRSRARGLGPEGHVLRVGRSVTIEAPTAAGVFYGGRTLLQLRRLGPRLPRGTATDRPAHRERGLMLDTAGRPYGRAYLEQRIREMGDLKLNLLQLHFTDDEGVSIRSRRHPRLARPGALTPADMRRLHAVARRRHVTIVPEFDMPGHLAGALRDRPDLQLVRDDGARQPTKLDVTSAAARRWAAEVVAGYAELFPGPWWHIGADEYLGAALDQTAYDRYPQLAAFARRRFGPEATGPDAVVDFVNFIGRVVRRRGKELRVWSDGLAGTRTARLDPRAVVHWWDDGPGARLPHELLDAGHRVVNASWWPLYYVTGGPVAHLRAPVAGLYDEFVPWRFEGVQTARWQGGTPSARWVARGHPRLLGAILKVWNDDPAAPGAAPGAVAAGIRPRLRALAERTWTDEPPPGGHAAFAARAARVLR